MYQIGQLIGILALSPRIGVYGLAWGVVIGSFLNFLIQVPSVISLKPLYFPTFGSKERHLVNVLSLMAPRIFGAAIVQLMLWVNTLLASKYDGAILAISYGFSLMMVAQIAIAQSVATAVMPTFSTQYASGKLDSLRSTLSSALRAEIFLSIPASVGLICLSTPLVAFLYQYGEFSEETTHMVAWALIWYSTGLVFHAVQEVLVRAFYAMHDTKTPVAVGSLAMTLSIGLSILFSSLFVRLGWMPHGGLALAVSLSTAVEVFALFIFMRRKLGNLHGTSIAIGFGIAASASMVMLGFLLGWLQITQSSPTYIVALGGSLLGGLVYVFVLGLFRIPELKWLLGNISNHLEKTKKVPPG